MNIHRKVEEWKEEKNEFKELKGAKEWNNVTELVSSI